MPHRLGLFSYLYFSQSIFPIRLITRIYIHRRIDYFSCRSTGYFLVRRKLLFWRLVRGLTLSFLFSLLSLTGWFRMIPLYWRVLTSSQPCSVSLTISSPSLVYMNVGASSSSALLCFGGRYVLSFSSSVFFLVGIGVISEGELTKWPRAWSSLADSKTPFSTASPSGLEASFGMAILRWGRGSSQGKHLYPILEPLSH